MCDPPAARPPTGDRAATDRGDELRCFRPLAMMWCGSMSRWIVNRCCTGSDVVVFHGGPGTPPADGSQQVFNAPALGRQPSAPAARTGAWPRLVGCTGEHSDEGPGACRSSGSAGTAHFRGARGGSTRSCRTPCPAPPRSWTLLSGVAEVLVAVAFTEHHAPAGSAGSLRRRLVGRRPAPGQHPDGSRSRPLAQRPASAYGRLPLQIPLTLLAAGACEPDVNHRTACRQLTGPSASSAVSPAVGPLRLGSDHLEVPVELDVDLDPSSSGTSTS